MDSRRKLVAANWKMNGSRTANAAWLKAFGARQAEMGPMSCEVVVCGPAVYLEMLVGQAPDDIAIGGQDVSEQASGAYTGDISAAMLVDVGCRWVIVGHSERRQMHSETDDVVAAKTEAALAAGLRPIVCVGETLAQREAKQTSEVVQRQLAVVLKRVGPDALVRGALAYEPVWAIGTGRTATPAQAQEVHALLRAQVAVESESAGAALRILYGGSVKPSNAAELFAAADIDGGLIGGASLVADDFAAICAAAGAGRTTISKRMDR